jgi:hypothetical protein
VRRVARPVVAFAGGVVVASTATCIPSLGPGDSLVTSTRILAIRSDPAEAPANTKVTFTALVASPQGTVTGARITWDFCTAPKPLTEDNVVSNACLDASSLVPVGVGPTATGKLPADACTLFGPNVGSTNFRPRDPDGTGGYYQPLRADLAGTGETFALARVACGLAMGNAADATAFAAQYKPNENPTLLPLTATRGGAPMALTSIPAGSRITLQASWPPASAETFAYFDPASQAVTHQREAMQVAWYATGGTLDTESTGRAANDPATTSGDGWSAPSAAGTVHAWVVLRDSRGGIDFTEVDLVVVE